jgi:hypothetical protein
MVAAGGGVEVEAEASGVAVAAKMAVRVSLGVGKTNAVGGAAPGRSQARAAARIKSGARSQGRGCIPTSGDD